MYEKVDTKNEWKGKAYCQLYLNDIIETQGMLFEKVADEGYDCTDFINKYMKSKLRAVIDTAHPKWCNLQARELFLEITNKDSPDYIELKKTERYGPFMALWIGEFYAMYQYAYNMFSRDVIEVIPLKYAERMYMRWQNIDLYEAVERAYEEYVKKQ